MITKIESDQVCPKCGYVITATQKILARYNFQCPGCGKVGIKDFELVTRTVAKIPRRTKTGNLI